MASGQEWANGRLKWILSVLGCIIVALVCWNFASVYSLQLASSGYGYNITAFRSELDAQRQLNATFQNTIQTLQVTNAQRDQQIVTMRQEIDSQRAIESGDMAEIRRKIDDVTRILNELLVRLGPGGMKK